MNTRFFITTRFFVFLLCAMTALSFAANVSAATLTVPSRYATIQAAINAAQPGDTVLIADGTYTGTGNVNLDTLGKAVTVASVNGPAKTVINCQGSSNARSRPIPPLTGEPSSATAARSSSRAALLRAISPASIP